jgi:GxxExxY protein
VEEDRKDAKTQRLGDATAAANEAAREVVDAAFEVHRTIGPGFGELVYENALGVELALRGIPFTRQARVAVAYKGHCVGEGRVDVLVRDLLVVELKCVSTLLPVHTAQLLTYLKATNRQLGLLINFDVALLKSGVKRVILTQ